jgi:glutathione reductase (NADPH)
LELDNLPKRIAFGGGGYISFEFAHIAARAGAHVTILHRTNKPMGQFDPGLVNQLELRTRELGVDVQLETAVKGIVRTPAVLLYRPVPTTTTKNIQLKQTWWYMVQAGCLI